MDPSTTPATTTREPAARSAPTRRWWLGAAFWLAVPLLVGLNGWLFWQGRPPASLRRIDVLISGDRLDEAESALRHLLSQSPRNGDARTRLARIFGRRKDYLELARQLELVPVWWPTRGEALFMIGQAYKQLNLARRAEAAWIECTAVDPLHPVHSLYYSHAARELVALYLIEGRLADARETIRRAYLASDPSERPGILIMRMAMELNRISHEEALETLRRYVAADPDDWEARRGLALEELAARQEETAERLLEECLRARPDDPAVWRSWLELHYQRGDRETIKAALPKLPKSADGDAEIWKFRGLAREWEDDLDGAIDAFTKAVELNPAEAEYLYKLGIAEQRAGRLDTAGEHLRKAQELRAAFPKMHDAYFDLLEQLETSRPGSPEYNASAEKLAGFCDLYGWVDEAASWRATKSGG